MLSERAKQISPSLTLDITSKAKKMKKEGRDVVILAAGEPDFPTPKRIKEAGILAIEKEFYYLYSYSRNCRNKRSCM